LKNQPPITEGPFTLTQDMKWEGFLNEVADLADIKKENVDAAITSMAWGFHKKNSLPLKGASGYKTMIQQIRAVKDLNAVIIFIYLAAPKRHCRKTRAVDSDENEGDGLDHR